MKRAIHHFEKAFIHVEYSDKISIISKKLNINPIVRGPSGYYKNQILYCCNGKQLDENKTFLEENIMNNSVIIIPSNIIGAGPIDNLMNENANKIGFDMRLIQRDELYINLIYFNSKMTDLENYIYFNIFKVDVVGGFHAINDLNILEKYLEEINNKKIIFIVLTSGSDGKDVINLCQQYSFVKEVIIFCSNYKYNKYYLTKYPGYVKRVITSMESLYKYLKTFDICEFVEGINNFFSFEQIQMNKQLKLCPLITAREYDKCYFLIHKAYSYFFDNMHNNHYSSNPKRFTYINQTKILDYLYETITDDKEKIKIYDFFESLKYSKDNNEFVEKSIKAYTGESKAFYLFNRAMRNFDQGLMSLAYFMGPLLFGLNKYVEDNPSFSFQEDMTLYRIINCSKFDFYSYKLNLNHIVCFPSITSTSSKYKHFKPSKNANKVNNINIKDEDFLKVKMVFNYKHESENKSPGIIIENKKGHDGKPISSYPKESEVILFPFTFARISKIESGMENGNQIQIIYFNIINRKEYLEYTLRDNYEKRLRFNKLD